MMPTLMTIVFSLQAAKSSTAFPCLPEKMGKCSTSKYVVHVISLRNFCMLRWLQNELIFNFYACLNGKFVQSPKRIKLFFFLGVLGNCNAFIMYEKIRKVTHVARRAYDMGSIQPSNFGCRCPRKCSFCPISYMQISTQHLHIYSFMNLFSGEKLREIAPGTLQILFTLQ